jgi:hypothetical protein
MCIESITTRHRLYSNERENNCRVFRAGIHPLLRMEPEGGMHAFYKHLTPKRGEAHSPGVFRFFWWLLAN